MHTQSTLKYTGTPTILWAGNKIFSQNFVLQSSFTTPIFCERLPTKNTKILVSPSSFTRLGFVTHSSFITGSHIYKIRPLEFLRLPRLFWKCLISSIPWNIITFSLKMFIFVCFIYYCHFPCFLMTKGFRSFFLASDWEEGEPFIWQLEITISLTQVKKPLSCRLFKLSYGLTRLRIRSYILQTYSWISLDMVKALC